MILCCYSLLTFRLFSLCHVERKMFVLISTSSPQWAACFCNSTSCFAGNPVEGFQMPLVCRHQKLVGSRERIVKNELKVWKMFLRRKLIKL